MKGQWTLIIALVFALIVAIFAVINVNPVSVDYLFGTASWPLILVILGSAAMGAFAVGAAGLFRVLLLQKRVRQLQKENEQLKKKVNEHLQNEDLRKQNYLKGNENKKEDTQEEEVEKVEHPSE
ncbi:LapA family protein [Bacillus sp. AK128]